MWHETWKNSYLLCWSSFFFFWPCCKVCWILLIVPQPGTKPAPPALAEWSLNWTSREVLARVHFGRVLWYSFSPKTILRLVKVCLLWKRKFPNLLREHSLGSQKCLEVFLTFSFILSLTSSPLSLGLRTASQVPGFPFGKCTGGFVPMRRMGWKSSSRDDSITI